ncbi:helix-turn-helix transcriptional regulator [Streptomyces sp. CA-278952]|uniref:helix-turn-helix transcriptional regulator n=1 Tax=unclassified Streptomyces TaxID=2593676 RepID=UPI00224297F2|nr:MULTISPECIES: helix-turn-helix transcriptional regulator [unclassified Streptomyces]UZI33397.1 helix-turn-helix transcriptional regulator [Streptomyces sp. VB1]WDG33283.1 helix-turn-helix transcriptional regulator [Streptomyces sp. CA-278952]
MKDLFTEHELAALRVLAQGRTQVEIAQTLRIRPETVGWLLNRVRILLRARTLPHTVARGFVLDQAAVDAELEPSGERLAVPVGEEVQR